MPKFEFFLPTMGKAAPAGLVPRDQVRRLSAPHRAGRQVRPADQPRWSRLVQPLSLDRRTGKSSSSSTAKLCLDGIADFNALHSGKYHAEVQLCAFDVLALDGEDPRSLPLSMRKTNLERLLRGRPNGIFINPFERGAIGPDHKPPKHI